MMGTIVADVDIGPISAQDAQKFLEQFDMSLAELLLVHKNKKLAKRHAREGTACLASQHLPVPIGFGEKHMVDHIAKHEMVKPIRTTERSFQPAFSGHKQNNFQEDRHQISDIAVGPGPTFFPPLQHLTTMM